MSFACAAALLVLGADPQYESCSIVVLEHSNKVVSRFVDSSVTHVGVLIYRGRQGWVYEATPNQVRQIPFTTYQRELAELNRRRKTKTRLWIMEPRTPYPRAQQLRMRSFMSAQLGRRYSVEGYVRKRDSEGVHCAQFAASVLDHSGRYQFSEPHKISPYRLVRQIRSTHRRPVELDLPTVRPHNASWFSGWNHRWYAFRHWCAWAWCETWAVCF